MGTIICTLLLERAIVPDTQMRRVVQLDDLSLQNVRHTGCNRGLTIDIERKPMNGCVVHLERSHVQRNLQELTSLCADATAVARHQNVFVSHCRLCR